MESGAGLQGVSKGLSDRTGAIRAILLGVVGLLLTWALVWSVPDARHGTSSTLNPRLSPSQQERDPSRGAAFATDGRWSQDGEDWLFLNAEDVPQTGWARSGDYWYYLRPADDVPSAGAAGTMVVGWAEIDGYRYYFDPDGAMHTGRLAYEGFEYYLSDERVYSLRKPLPYGSMVTGFVEMGQTTSYYVEQPCPQLFLWGSYPAGARVSGCQFASWGTSVRHAASGQIDGVGRVFYRTVL